MLQRLHDPVVQVSIYVAVPMGEVPVGVPCVTFWCNAEISEKYAKESADVYTTKESYCEYPRGSVPENDACTPGAWCIVRRDLLPESHPEHRVVVRGPNPVQLMGRIERKGISVGRVVRGGKVGEVVAIAIDPGHEQPVFGEAVIVGNHEQWKDNPPPILSISIRGRVDDLTIYSDKCSDAMLLDGYTQSQREDSKVDITPEGKERASAEWSAQLRLLVKKSADEERERERLKVVCDRDDDGE